MVTSAGLTSAEAAERLRRDGPNVLPAKRGRPAWLQLAGQLTHFFALMLWVAAVLALAADLAALSVAIVVVILFNGVFAFVQEYRAERAAERLRELLPRKVTVIRDGAHVDIDAEYLVVGDVVVLGAGDRVSADLVLDEGHGVLVDTSTFTGESVPDAAEVGTELYSGCFVVEGEGFATVTASGAWTRLAGIAELTRGTRRPMSPLAIELRRVVRVISAMALTVGGAFFFVAFALDRPLDEAAVFAIGVTVALVPEALLPTVTLSLAMGGQRMARKGALVRRLESVETLGSTTFICSDKTGTLTMNEMEVVEVWTPLGALAIRGEGYAPEAELEPESPEVLDLTRRLAVAGVRCSSGHAVLREGVWQAQGDPMEAALDALGRRVGADVAGDRQASPDRRRFSFDPRRRRMSVLAGERLLVKGAPDAVLPCCATAPGAAEAVHGMASSGRRVLAIAERHWPGDPPSDPAEAETGLELLGLVGIEDPPRVAAAGAVAACRGAGIRIGMVTGDHPATAEAIAREVGLIDIADEPFVVGGAELPEDIDTLGELLDRDGVVVARVDPEQKLRIALALQVARSCRGDDR